MKKRRRTLGGAMRMRELGHRLVQVWLSPAEYAAVEVVARYQGRRVATWMRWQCCVAAEKQKPVK